VTPRARLAVLGSPIGHSRSPALHRAAYRALGLDWLYDSAEVTGATLAAYIGSRDESWRGLSLTMPLKRDVLPLLDSIDATASLTGAANTVLFDRSGERLALRGFNTDVYGIVEAFRDAGVLRLGTARVLGGGATAASVIVAVARLGAERVDVSVRSPERSTDLVALGAAVGVDVTLGGFADWNSPVADAVVSTLPGRRELELDIPAETRAGAVLFDVAYDPWPSALAAQWLGGSVISGLEMLLHQALVQVRIFVGGTPDLPLEREAEVLRAMRAALGH
jgi:shikimate dehydrogenase